VSTGSVLTLVTAALLLAAATFVRPITYYLPLLFMPLLAFRAAVGRSPIGDNSIGDRPGANDPTVRGATAAIASEKAKTDRRGRVWGCLAAAGFAVVALAPCAAWQVRNYVETGYSGFSGIPECNLYFFQGASILARQSGKSLREVQVELGQNDPQLLSLLHGPQQAATVRRLGAEGRRLVAKYPVEYAKIHARGTAILALDPGAADLLRILGRYPAGVNGLRPLSGSVVDTFARMRREVPEAFYLNLAFGVALGLVYCAAALGLLAACRRLNWQWTFLLVTLAYFLAVSGGSTGCARLRLPMMPLVCILAGHGIAVLSSRWQAKPQRNSGRSRLAAAEMQLTHAA
jgi:hypothetical protein